ncbi:hypothetical protein HC891_12410 [Candidatus Gracilibacteria bacterium]|nr:hypothetical protein [Candidatus Gracilibacteria bacterium]
MAASPLPNGVDDLIGVRRLYTGAAADYAVELDTFDSERAFAEGNHAEGARDMRLGLCV